MQFLYKVFFPVARKFKANESYFGALRPFMQPCRNFQGQPRRVEKSAPGEPVVKRAPDLAPPPRSAGLLLRLLPGLLHISNTARCSHPANESVRRQRSAVRAEVYHPDTLSDTSTLEKRDEAGKSSGHSSVQKFSIQRFRVKIFAVSHPDFPSSIRRNRNCRCIWWTNLSDSAKTV